MVETSWNVEHRFQGQRAEPELNDQGRKQAAALAQCLESRSIDAAYTSDSLRARQTAETICENRNFSITEAPDLRELDFGEWEGLTHDEAQRVDPERVRAWEQAPLEYAPPGGENLKQLASRSQRFIESLLQAHRDETLLLVSHGGPLRVLLATSLGLAATEYWRLRIDPGSLSELYLYPAGGMLTQLNFAPSRREV